jgi:hypothetical protein
MTEVNYLYLKPNLDLYLKPNLDLYLKLSLDLYLKLSLDLYLKLSLDLYLKLSLDPYLFFFNIRLYYTIYNTAHAASRLWRYSSIYINPF